jgi:hypothetical protein
MAVKETTKDLLRDLRGSFLEISTAVDFHAWLCLTGMGG